MCWPNAVERTSEKTTVSVAHERVRGSAAKAVRSHPYTLHNIFDVLSGRAGKVAAT